MNNSLEARMLMLMINGMDLITMVYFIILSMSFEIIYLENNSVFTFYRITPRGLEIIMIFLFKILTLFLLF